MGKTLTRSEKNDREIVRERRVRIRNIWDESHKEDEVFRPRKGKIVSKKPKWDDEEFDLSHE